MTRLQSRCARALARLGRLVAVAGLMLCLFRTGDVRAQVEPKTPKVEATTPKVETPTPKVVAPLTADYKELTPDPPTLRGWARAMGREPSLYATVKQMVLGSTAFVPDDFDKFFTKQVFPQFTLYKSIPDLNLKSQTNVLVVDAVDEKSDESFQKSRLPKMRDIFLTQFLNPCKDKFTFDHLADLTVTSMREIALGNYHPLARFNAVMLLGSLHEYQSPELYAKAWPVLVDCLDTIAPAKVAAMNSILRHAKGGIPANQQAGILERLEKIVADKTVAKGETPEAHDWVRRKAIEVLVASGDQAISPKVVADFVAIVNDPQSSVELACAAAKALGAIRANALGNIDLSMLAANIGRVGVAAARAELSRAEERAFAAPLPILAGGGAGGFVPGRRVGPIAPPADGVAGADAAPAPTEQYIAVALVKGQLVALDAGFIGPPGGVTAAANGTNHAQNVDRIEGSLKALIVACDDKAPDYETLKRQLEKAADALEGKLGKGAATPPGGKAAADAFEAFDKAAPPKNTKTPAGK